MSYFCLLKDRIDRKASQASAVYSLTVLQIVEEKILLKDFLSVEIFLLCF